MRHNFGLPSHPLRVRPSNKGRAPAPWGGGGSPAAMGRAWLSRNNKITATARFLVEGFMDAPRITETPGEENLQNATEPDRGSVSRSASRNFQTGSRTWRSRRRTAVGLF